MTIDSEALIPERDDASSEENGDGSGTGSIGRAEEQEERSRSHALPRRARSGWIEWILTKIIILTIGASITTFFWEVGALGLSLLLYPPGGQTTIPIAAMRNYLIFISWAVAGTFGLGTIVGIVCHDGSWIVPCWWPRLERHARMVQERQQGRRDNDDGGGCCNGRSRRAALRSWIGWILTKLLFLLIGVSVCALLSTVGVVMHSKILGNIRHIIPDGHEIESARVAWMILFFFRTMGVVYLAVPTTFAIITHDGTWMLPCCCWSEAEEQREQEQHIPDDDNYRYIP